MPSATYTQELFEKALERCASEPIHQIALIQPHGALLVVGADAGRTLLQASANLAEFLDLPSGGVHGRPLAEILGQEQAMAVENLLATAGPKRVATGTFRVMRQQVPKKLHARVFASGEVCVLELSNDDNGQLAEHLDAVLLPMQQALLHADTERGAAAYLDRIADTVHSLFGFDRVMVYRFDPDWDGEVIAEYRRDGLASYLGHRFPASDIPPQARQLYACNLVRLVVDVQAEPVAVLPAVNPVTQQPLDMTQSSLRSFSPVHVEYLRNMGVQASMSISLLQNGRLWGLIACHHMEPRPVSNALQQSAVLISQMASAKLSSLESRERRNLGNEVSAIISLLLEHITTESEEVILQKMSRPTLDLMDSTGMIVIVEGKPYSLGEAPAQNEIDVLLSWLASLPPEKCFACDCLSQRFPHAASYAAVASGLLVSPLTSDMRNAVIWLRPEKPRTVRWAGHLEKTVSTDADGSLRLSPRKSFDTWTETWKGHCNSWRSAETEAAIILAAALSKGLAQKSRLEKEIVKQKLADAELRVAAIAFESQGAIFVTDANRTILKVNQAFCRITGYSSTDVVGKSSDLLRSTRHDETFYREKWRTIDEDGHWSGEVWSRRKNGNGYLEWRDVSRVCDETGLVTNYVIMFIDITESRNFEKTIHQLSFYDSLTSLPNRRLLLDRLKHALGSAERNQQLGAILIIDLDDFKTLNDTRGHEVGDQLLLEVARRLQSCVRSDDTVARLGGDEFAVMLDRLSPENEDAAMQANNVAKKILDAIARPFSLRGEEHFTSPSIGITLFRSEDVSAEELIKRADTAMYQAKYAGRNTYRFFDPQTQAALESRALIEAWMRRASLAQFVLHYQIQVQTGGQAIGAEALIRWQHPEKGMIFPTAFIPLAEETGLILSIGQWVLETACHQIKTWAADPALCELQLAVNVSARQFRQAEFVGHVQRALEVSGADPVRLKLELTESMVLEDVQDTIEKMRALKNLGVRFSMDDFGTGYSSLSYLTQLPLNQLKIDRSFVRNIEINPSDAVIVQTIIGMALNLGMEVIAEGVETDAQLEFLTKHGCHAFQGYLFGKPMPLGDFERMVTDRPA